MNKVDICVLLETKLSSTSLDSFLLKFFNGWGWYCNHDANPGGRILVLWRKDLFGVNISFISAQLVHCKVNIVGGLSPFDFSVVYGLHTVATRRDLWIQLEACYVSTPWIMGGDFNTMFNMEAKLGGNAINYFDIYDGINWLQKSCLEEVRCLGPKFSWCNRQEGNDRIYSKLDWVFYNEKWFDAYNACFTSYHGDHNSDHCFLLLKCI